MSLTVDLLTIAKKVNNYIVDAGDNAAGNLKWDSNTQQVYTVPINKRWVLMQSHVILSDSATLVIYARDVSDNTIALLANYSAGTGSKQYPAQAISARTNFPFFLDAGEDIFITCGAAQGAGAKASCVVLEIDV